MSEIVKRSLSGLVYVSLVLLTPLYSPLFFSILIGFFLAVGSYEFAKLQGLKPIILVLISLGFYFVFPFIGFESPLFYEIISFISFIVILFLSYYLFNKQATIINNWFNCILYIGYILAPFLLLIKLQGESKEIVLCIFLLIWCNDTFAYLSGMAFGKTKLFPSVSPKKTIEGFAGGALVTMIISLVLYYFSIIPALTIAMWIGFALIISIFGSLGDLVQSKLKRVAGVKDSGSIMPGHGGVLDRLDSVIYITPIIYLFTKIIIYVS